MSQSKYCGFWCMWCGGGDVRSGEENENEAGEDEEEEEEEDNDNNGVDKEDDTVSNDNQEKGI